MKTKTIIVHPLEWKTLRRNARLKSGDRAVYAGGIIGDFVFPNEIGMTVAESGYYSVCRKKP